MRDSTRREILSITTVLAGIVGSSLCIPGLFFHFIVIGSCLTGCDFVAVSLGEWLMFPIGCLLLLIARLAFVNFDRDYGGGPV